ncbi:hypothetical protein OG339_10855 [Streptosporangium sp. NBC_01495]|uniref:hypothetical protein n=1 Tax=Streptosporangium sp. NBC_01495 TaxID=2903899 RepID=UPI002E35BBAB|nr:hypothetical protein [Streptosporangium sp. NBC_01495]
MTRTGLSPARRAPLAQRLGGRVVAAAIPLPPPDVRRPPPPHGDARGRAQGARERVRGARERAWERPRFSERHASGASARTVAFAAGPAESAGPPGSLSSRGAPVASVIEPRAFLMERLAGHEIPERGVVGALPRNQSGKVIKRESRGLFEAAATGRTEGT